MMNFFKTVNSYVCDNVDLLLVVFATIVSLWASVSILFG
jgi:hypothetical protein